MKTEFNHSQRGSVGFNIVLILLLGVICVLIYVLLSNTPTMQQRTIGIETPEQTHSHNMHTDTAAPTYTDADEEYDPRNFDDGLGTPSVSKEYPLDELESGLAETNLYIRDINNDGYKDRITRTRTETGTAHWSYAYTIELGTDNGFIDITPDGFETIEGAECSLQKLRFIFNPSFGVVKISREFNEDWVTPTPAVRDIYTIVKNSIHHLDRRVLDTVCDVSELFEDQP